MKAADLHCAPTATQAAMLLEHKFPDINFTSGRRGLQEQARAMASNVVMNRKWIAQTYTSTDESRALQAAVDSHPKAKTQAEITSLLMVVMMPWADDKKDRLSKHFSGRAWDVQPINGPHGEAVKAFIRTLPGLKKFLEKEGGLTRWHADF